jgi:hypothetical protein
MFPSTSPYVLMAWYLSTFLPVHDDDDNNNNYWSNLGQRESIRAATTLLLDEATPFAEWHTDVEHSVPRPTSIHPESSFVILQRTINQLPCLQFRGKMGNWYLFPFIFPYTQTLPHVYAVRRLTVVLICLPCSHEWRKVTLHMREE